MEKTSKIKGLVYGILSSSTFGLIPLFAVPAMNSGIGLNSLVLYRFGISALVLGLWMLITRQNLRITVKEIVTIFFLGLFYGRTAIMLTASYQFIPSGIATTIHFLYPVVVTAIMVLFFKDKVSIMLIAAILLAISGVYMLSSGDGAGELNFKGLVLVLATVVTYALYIVGVNKSAVAKMDGLKLTFYVLLVGAFVFTGNLLFRGESLDLPQDFSCAMDLVLLALVPTVVSDFTLIKAVQNVGSTTTAVLGCMEPLTAVAMGVLFLGESFAVKQMVGIIVVLVAVTMVIIANSRTAKK